MDEKRYIEVNALMEDRIWKCGGDPYDPFYMGYQDALDNVEVTIDNQPTADVVEVVHGRWIVESDESIRCSVCCFNRAHIKMPMDYCPNCGAYMRDGDGNG